MRIKRWDVCLNIRERFGHYSVGQVPPVPALRILMETLFSAVQLLVGLTVVEARALFGSHHFCRDIPMIIPVQRKATHRRYN
jgi:hypothetical protein